MKPILVIVRLIVYMTLGPFPANWFLIDSYSVKIVNREFFVRGGEVVRKKINIFICTLMVLAMVSFPKSEAKASALQAELEAMVEAGVVQGFGGGDLRPNENVTRGQFATFMTRALDLPPGQHVFTDVPTSSPLAAGINSAYAAGLVGGYSKTSFGPGKNITRQEASAIIARALKKFKGVTSKQVPITFSDVKDISPGFIADVNLNAEYQIIRGIANSDGTFRFLPQKTASRAEAAAFIARMLKVPNGDGGSTDPKPDPVVKIPTEDIAFSNSTITLYVDANFTKNDKNFSYEGNNEMKLLETTANYVKIQVADKIAYAKPSDVTVVQAAQVQGRSYYTVNTAGELVHYIYRPASNTYDFEYIVGKAPSFLAQGQKYYSWNGTEFITSTGTTAGGKAVQYFNLLAARSTTEYSAADLDKYINKVLADVETLYKNNPTGYPIYKDATTRSKLIGLGAAVKEAEAKHGINGLIILSWAMHESKYGMSDTAQIKNNLFGLNAIDGTNLARSFNNVGESIDDLANSYLNKNYIEPGSPYFHGAVLGNKGIGFNVKYASDPYWGQKIAGHMYRIDKFLGGKELGKYRIAETKVESVNVRPAPGIVIGNVQYQYTNTGVPVTIKAAVNHTDGVWYEVVPDSKNYTKGYIRADGLTELTVVK
jgi:beta-N-acetylglucosaminidase